MKTIASGLLFPEGPIAMEDGSVVLVEIARGTLSRVTTSGHVEIIADLGGGPNGAAIGPDGHCYVCNNGGFEWHMMEGLMIPGDIARDYSGGRIERVDLKTGKFEVVYRECNGLPLNGPNDIVFDRSGGFWFTDLGKGRGRTRDRGGLYYARPDGSMIKEVVFPIVSPNGVGLSPDEKIVYVADTTTARLWAFDIVGPGEVAPMPALPEAGRYIGQGIGNVGFDSLAVDSEGNINVATVFGGGITVISPDGSRVHHVPADDPGTTNICFGGKDMKTAYITLSCMGRLAAMDWPVAGLKLNFLNK